MERYWNTQGIVLKNYPIGENHLGCLIATENRGNLQVILHGGASAKGKLRRGSEVLSEHRFFLYEDPKKSSIKVTDLDNSIQLDLLRNSLIGYTCATLGAEIMIHIHTEQSPEIYRLFSGLLRGLEQVEAHRSNEGILTQDKNSYQSFKEITPTNSDTNRPYKKVVNSLSITSVYLWKLMQTIGILPDLYTCVDTEELLQDQPSHLYSLSMSGFVNIGTDSGGVSKELSYSKSNLIALIFPGIKVVRWIIDQTYSRAFVEPLPDLTLPSLTLLSAQIIEHYLGRKLKSLEMLRSLI
jgi:recombinational DNA repair protein (RecF pathway)